MYVVLCGGGGGGGFWWSSVASRSHLGRAGGGSRQGLRGVMCESDL